VVQDSNAKLSGTEMGRIALVVFVLTWIFGPDELEAAVPIWVPFLIALGLELHFFAGGQRPAPAAPCRPRPAGGRPRPLRLR
jgi:hypothetical protein